MDTYTKACKQCFEWDDLMLSLFGVLLFFFYICSQRIWDNYYPSCDWNDSLTYPYCFLSIFDCISIDYEESNALPFTK